ncbi:hypothetical protein GW932_03960 [archaeon]|nr:hypothetical protein [archaeon]
MISHWNYTNFSFSALNNILSLENEQEKKEKLNNFIDEMLQDHSNEPAFMLDRFLELRSDIKLLDVPEGLMNSLKESLFCYVNGQYLAAIATAGTASELFCVYLYEHFLIKQGLERLQIKHSIRKFRRDPQDKRIEKLKNEVGLIDEICSALHEIKRKRNNSVHPQEKYDFQLEALDCLQNVIDILNLWSNSKEIADEVVEENAESK